MNEKMKVKLLIELENDLENILIQETKIKNRKNEILSKINELKNNKQED